MSANQWAADGYFVMTSIAQTSGADGSGYRELKYHGHTYGKTPEEWLRQKPYDWTSKTVYHFFKISDTIRLRPSYTTIPAKTDLDQIENLAVPITDMRWMTGEGEI